MGWLTINNRLESFVVTFYRQDNYHLEILWQYSLLPTLKALVRDLKHYFSKVPYEPLIFGQTGLHHVETCLRAYAGSEVPDQPAHTRSLIRAFTVH